MDEFLKVAGVVCRYVIAALACWWFFWFLALIGQPSGRSQELAGMAFGKAIVCGIAAAIWFYRARKVKNQAVMKHVDSSLNARQSVLPVQPNLPSPPTTQMDAQVIPPSDSSPESHQPVTKQTSGWAVIVVFVVVLGLCGIITAIVASFTNIEPKPLDLSGISASKPTNVSTPFNSSVPPSSSTAPCPTALPSGVNSKALNPVDLSKVIGADGTLTSEQSYDSSYAPNGRAWNATLSYENKTSNCITMAMVELELSYAGTASKERHSIVFRPILGVGNTQTVSVGLRIRTPERSEDVAVLGWRTISASGFASGGDAPTYDANGFQIVKDQKDDPFAAYGGHLITPSDPKNDPAKVAIPEDVARGRLLQKTEPLYPPIAKAARVYGIVVLHATISKGGSIKELNVLSGPSLLQQAALEAVKTWKYKPYIVNNAPVDVETEVRVSFALGG